MLFLRYLSSVEIALLARITHKTTTTTISVVLFFLIYYIKLLLEEEEELVVVSAMFTFRVFTINY